MPRDIRRIVTGHDAQGRSNITFNGPALNLMESPGWPGSRLSELWVTEEMPVDNTGLVDRGARPIRHDPTPGGTIFRVVEIPPESQSKIDTAATFADLGSTHVPSAEDTAKHPTMHVTDSVDYLVVISGEMHMVMEDGEVLLQPGDCIVQRGTKHAWSNRGTEPCLLAAILVDAKPAL
ncbi:cupin domain-containing protein [Phenylobacterium sp. LH3H17]|uniref:cupin domain-containing protein n=1 Tax=Phenylobacterium sp. LH3H17 TaxID=2903901 RepID=UPI0020C96CDC|nr:cupin domain-containing protein [Phenylobacterium sp. LH3H17]UTP38207.1 cupin domain-containing protein [Phenylobacterium sp. LH3H17]